MQYPVAISGILPDTGYKKGRIIWPDVRCIPNKYRYRSIQILFRNTEKTRSTSLTERYLNIIFFLYKAVEKGRGTVVAAGSSDAMFGGGDSADDDEEVRSL